MKRQLLKHSLYTSGCALLVATPFIWSWTWPVGILGLVLMLYALSKAEKFTTKQFLVQSLLFGYVFFGVVLGWIYGIHTTELIGNTIFAILFLGLTYLIMVGGLAVGFLFFGILYRSLRISTNNWTILYIPLLFALSEFLRSVFFSVVSFGDGGSIGPYWNFGSLGFLTMNTPLKYASRMVGLYGTSLLVVVIAIVLFQLLHKRYRYTLIILIPLIISMLGWSLYRKSNGVELKVATASVHSDVEDGYQADLSDKISNTGDTNLLVLPEYSYYFVDSDGKRTDRKIPDNVALTVDSSTKREGDDVKNAVSYYDNQSRLLQDYEKRFLVPGGEFIPYIYQVILFYSGNTSLINQFHEKHAVNQSSQQEQSFEYAGVRYGSLACSGAIAPNFYSSLTKEGAQILTNSASISTLGVSPLYYKQASQMSSFIAIANARPFIQSARGGSSYILTKDGTVVKTIQASSQSELTSATVTTNKKKTPSSQLGEWTIWLSFGAVLLLGMKSWKGLFKKKKI